MINYQNTKQEWQKVILQLYKILIRMDNKHITGKLNKNNLKKI